METPQAEKITAVDTAKPASPPSDTPSKFRALLQRRSVWLVLVLFVAALFAFGYHWAFGTPEVIYNTAAVERGNIESTVVAAGIVQPFKYVDVGAQTSGVLKSLKVIRGNQVKKDQLIAEIDPVLADTALIAANAEVENMVSQRSVKQAQRLLAKVQRDRNEKLFARGDGSVSASDRDITRANYDVALAEVASLSAQIKQATAAVDTAKANLGYTKIMAPMAGEVVSITLLEGQTLNANQQAPNILRIADISTVTVWAQVSEADIVRVKPNLNVYFTVLGSPRRWNGTVRQILPTPELINNVVFYDVLFDIPNPERELKIQMTAQVFIVLAEAKAVLLVPAAAIGTAGEGTSITVRVLKEDGTVEQRAIKIGIKSEILAEVTEGLKEKELIIVGEVAEKGKKKSSLTARKGP
ncbi:MAG TPA: efflux RND transporter periplasmic adaptor subunit [Desulfuromonadales bacterium]|nr:efflux RND transporter periplasmic adaptor subunit [Desulfuromonadales bacterium]